MIGLIATKEGMTRVFHENGESIPVSVIKVDPNIVSQIKNEETDGYFAVQLSSNDRKEKKVIKPNKGHFSKNKIKASVVSGPYDHIKKNPGKFYQAEISLNNSVFSDLIVGLKKNDEK